MPLIVSALGMTLKDLEKRHGELNIMLIMGCSIELLKMYKKSEAVVKFTEKNLRVESTAEGKGLPEVKIKSEIFPEDVLSPLGLVIVMMPFNHILRKCTRDNKLHNHRKN